jgi:chorismate lyase/3-hydroxybenzoate synthase
MTSSLTSIELAPMYVDRAEGSPLLGALVLPLPQLGGEPRLEVWRARREPERGVTHGIDWAHDGEVLFGSIAAAESNGLESLSRDVYARAIAFVRESGYPYFLRMWNHVGDINALDGDRERYQLFCAGRHDAFAEAGYHLSTDLPSASAVGMRGKGLMSYFLAAREPGVQIENPRQVAAYRYPRQYAPKSPSFSRATVFGETVFVSGTSSVLGHASVHVDDIDGQLDETLRNIEAVLERAIPDGSLANIITAKTYVRRREDHPRIAKRLESVFARNLFLEADICRAELLLEIEAVAR